MGRAKPITGCLQNRARELETVPAALSCFAVTLNNGWTYREQVGPEGGGLTILDFLAATRLHSTSDEWARRLERGEVEVDGSRVDTSALLHPGQTITWHRPPWHEGDVPTNFTIVHEDDSIIAVDKPAGLPTMPAGGYLNHTLLALMRETYPEASPLHRLGRHTSGLVLFARTHAAASALARAWRDRSVKKTYRALGVGERRTERFVIDVPIGPVPHPLLGTVQAASDDGKPITQHRDGARGRPRSHSVQRRYHHRTPTPGAHSSCVRGAPAGRRSFVRGGRRTEA